MNSRRAQVITHRVNCPIEFPIFARLEAPEKIHQLSQLQISVFIANYLGEFIYLLNGEFGLQPANSARFHN